MSELCQVWVGSLRHDITQQETEDVLEAMGFFNFVVRMGVSGFPMWGAFCFVEFEDLIDANDLRHDLLEVSAQIGKCMPHRYSQCETQ